MHFDSNYQSFYVVFSCAKNKTNKISQTKHSPNLQGAFMLLLFAPIFFIIWTAGWSWLAMYVVYQEQNFKIHTSSTILASMWKGTVLPSLVRYIYIYIRFLKKLMLCSLLYIYVYICICMYMYVCVCLYIYIYIVLRLPGSNPAFCRGRLRVSFRFEYRLPVPEHRN